MKLYWCDTGWGCGGLLVNGQKIVGGAPIFRKLIGSSIGRISAIYDCRRIHAKPR